MDGRNQVDGLEIGSHYNQRHARNVVCVSERVLNSAFTRVFIEWKCTRFKFRKTQFVITIKTNDDRKFRVMFIYSDSKR